MNTSTKTSVGTKFRYAFGELGSQISWYMINSYLMLFYTDIVGLTAGAISFIMLVARVWDAVNDPMMGMICDRTSTKWGKFRPYLMFTPPFLAIFNILTFTVFPLEGAAKVAVCLICYVAMGMLYTVVSTAYFAMVNVISNDSQDKQNLSAARNAGNSVANIVLSAVAMPLILKFSSAVGPDGAPAADAHGFFIAAIIFSLAMIPCFWIAASCKETYGNDFRMVDEEKSKSIIKSLGTVIKNDQLMLVMANTVGGTIGIMGRMTLLSYYVIYVVGNYTLIAPVYLIISIGTLIGSFLIPFGTKKMGKRNYAILLNTLMLATFIILYVVTDAGSAVILGVSFLTGISNSAQGVIYGMISDSIDYSDYKLGIREEGLCSSFLTLSVKLATAIVGTCGVLFLAKTGYVPNQEQTEAVKNSINFLINIVPAICVGVSMIPMFFYKLSNEKMAEIAEELNNRRKNR